MGVLRPEFRRRDNLSTFPTHLYVHTGRWLDTCDSAASISIPFFTCVVFISLFRSLYLPPCFGL